MEAIILWVCLFLIIWRIADCLQVAFRFRVREPDKSASYSPYRCKVCGCWTCGGLCSECCTWGEMQTIEAEKRMQFKHLGEALAPELYELKRRRKAAGW